MLNFFVMSLFITEPLIFEGSNIKPENYGLTWRFHPLGIFSETIFGPIYDYTCACNIVRPPKYICPVCNVESKPAYMRAYTIGKIKLNVPVPHPLILLILHKYESLFGMYVYDENNGIQDKSLGLYIEKKVLSPFGIWLHLLAKIYNVSIQTMIDKFGSIALEKGLYLDQDLDLYEQVSSLIYNKLNDNKQLIQAIKNNVSFDNAFVEYVNVLPAGVRDINIAFGKNLTVLNLHDINRDYLDLLSANKKLDIDETSTKYFIYGNMLHKLYKIEHKIISSFIKKKTGPIRGKTLGRRIDLSTRSVLVGNPAIKPNEVVVPYICAFMLLEDKIISKLIEQKQNNITERIDYVYQTLKVDETIKKIIDEIINKEDVYVLLMRQPVLHLPSTMQFKIAGVYDGFAIQMNQLVWEGYNADADGDTVVLFYLDSKNDKFDVTKHLFVPHGGLNVNILYDSLAGYVIAS